MLLDQASEADSEREQVQYARKDFFLSFSARMFIRRNFDKKKTDATIISRVRESTEKSRGHRRV